MCKEHGGNDCSCGCHSGCDGEEEGGFERQFLTKKEQLEELQDYLEELKLEVQAVEEHIANLKN
jgi:hypothetical protein